MPLWNSYGVKKKKNISSCKMGNCEEQLPEKPVRRLLAISSSR